MKYAPLTSNPEATVEKLHRGTLSGIEIETSGSTGASKSVLLSRTALLQAAHLTTSALGDPGNWLLALPLTRVAGIMVYLRARASGTQVFQLPKFDVPEFLSVAESMPSAQPKYVSLVPTQIRRLLQHPRGLACLQEFSAILVGGQGFPDAPDLSQIIRTYGMTETCGGVVWDGVALPGVQLAIQADQVLINSPTLADGYLLAGEFQPLPQVTVANQQYFPAPDRGRLVSSDTTGVSHLEVLGRLDEVINSGGYKVYPRPVETAMARTGLAHGEILVLGVPHAEFGEQVIAVIEAGEANVAVWRKALTDLHPWERPQQIWVHGPLPRLISGKIDTNAVRLHYRN